MTERILIIEDSEDIQEMIGATLQDFYKTTPARTINEAYERLKSETYDALIVDLRLPDGNGFQLCTWVRSQAQYAEVPVIFLTAADESAEKVMAFSIGADDYVVKPFDSMELLARVRTRLKKKSSSPVAVDDVFMAGPFKFDLSLKRVLVCEGVKEAELESPLTPTEFKLFQLIAKRAGKLVTRDEIVRSVWPNAKVVTDASIYTHMCTLRKKLGPYRDFVRSIPHVGYHFKNAEKLGA